MARLRLTLSFRHGLLVGGVTPSLLADEATAREPGGAPLIPASAVKGALRIEFERILRGLGATVCDMSSPGGACPRDNPCPACQLFGSPGREGILRFGDATLTGADRSLFTRRKDGRSDRPEEPTGLGYMLRPGVAISRVRKVAEEDLLFSHQIVAPLPSLRFTVDIEILDKMVDGKLLEWLKAAAMSLRAIGADKSRGLGHLEEAQLEELQEQPSEADEEGPSRPVSVAAGGTGPNGADFRLVLRPEEYVRVSGVKAGNNFMETLSFLPGSTVRGAVARSFVHREKGGNRSDTAVRNAFLHQPAVFTNFYPSPDAEGLPNPVPLSARTCKYYPGFARQVPAGQDHVERHGAKDILVAATLVKLCREAAKDWRELPLALVDRCRLCAAPLKPLEGFYKDPWTGVTDVCSSRRVVTKTALNRARFTSAEGQLYSYEVLDTELQQPQEQRPRFIGVACGVTDELAHHLERAGTALIGGARGRGFGKVSIERIEPAPQEGPEKWKDRLERFTQGLREPLCRLHHPRADRLFFALTLTSDLVMPTGRGQGWLRQVVASRLGLNQEELVLEKAFSRIVYCSGFNAAIGFRKDLLPALAMGSAFVFSYPDGENVRASIVENLPGLLRDGIGWRREEGCGRVSFCDDFHLERQEQG